MKKQILIISASVIYALPIKAQVTLTQSNHAPVVGDINNTKEFDTTGNILTTLTLQGNGVTWDFTGLMYSNGNYFSDVYVNPSSLPGTSTFTNAGANIALPDSEFFKSSSTALEYLGNMSPSGEVFDITTNPGKKMSYPFSYGSSYTDNTSGTMSSSSFPPFNITGTITVTGNGQGTLILPSNPNIIYNNVLKVYSKVNLLIQGTGTLSSVTGTQTIEMYDFYVSGQKFPVLSVQYEKLQIPAMGINSMDIIRDHNGSFTLGIQNNMAINYLSVYPNPVKDILQIEGINNKNVVIKI